MNNYDYITKMSVNKMAKWLEALASPSCPTGTPRYDNYCIDDKCVKCWKEWLESEIEK